MLVSFLLWSQLKKALITSFDEQLQARALLVAAKTSVQPRIVPLPQGEENFAILYVVNNAADTLFLPQAAPFMFPSGKDSITANNGWRTIRVRQPLDNGGSIVVAYALPSAPIDSRIHDLTLLIWMVLPAGFILSALVAYWLSSRLIKPVMQVITLANSINLNNNTILLQEPEAADELRELIVSFNRMLLRIKEQSDRQIAFFASASHELRTPLSTMQTHLQVLMQAEPATPQLRELYGEQLKEVKHLARMVNDFLLLSELRSGHVTIYKAKLNFSDLISESIAKFKSKAAAKGMQFKISYEPITGNYDLYADPEKLGIIISNLLDNAIKYSPPETTVEIFIQRKDANFTVIIKNEIREDINPSIVDVKSMFYHSRPLHGEGFGLGLWIANQLAAIHGMELYFSIEAKKYFEAGLITENV